MLGRQDFNPESVDPCDPIIVKRPNSRFESLVIHSLTGPNLPRPGRSRNDRRGLFNTLDSVVRDSAAGATRSRVVKRVQPEAAVDSVGFEPA